MIPFAMRVAALRREGRFQEAADLCLKEGAPLDAADLYAEAWAWKEAIAAAEAGGRPDLAYDYALSGSLRTEAERIRKTLADTPVLAEAAAALAARRGHHEEAGLLFEAASNMARAAEEFGAAGALFSQARCLETEGHYREAGRLYERRVHEAPWDGEAALRLGRILAQFGRYEHAVRALQKAAEDPERARGARRLLVACFSAMGMHDAAATCLDALRAGDPSLPMSVSGYLHESFGDARGIRKDDDGDRVLAGRYRIVRQLGAGATGRVLLARDDFYDRDVAIKVLTVGGGSTGRDAYARFAREARVAAGLHHPNVVRVHEYHPEGPFLIMELMTGGTLEERLQEGPLGHPLVRHVTQSILDGLEAVHRRGVIHRDLKPANVFFGEGGVVKIGDFGVAHLADLGATLTGAMLGTLAYMAPEQITGGAQPNASTDLYAVGVLLYRMLTGTLPYPGPDFVAQHLDAPIPTPSMAAPDLPPAFDDLIRQLLEKSPEARPRSADDVRTRLLALPFREDNAQAPAPRPAPGAEAHRASVPAPKVEERYGILDALEGGAYRARDTVLDRIVKIVPCDAALADRLRALARCDSPHLQAIYEVDAEAGRAIVEHPSGKKLSETHLDAERAAEVRRELEGVLRLMHDRKVAHGAIDATHIVIGDARSVLLLPLGTEAGDPETDRQQLDRTLSATASAREGPGGA